MWEFYSIVFINSWLIKYIVIKIAGCCFRLIRMTSNSCLGLAHIFLISVIVRLIDSVNRILFPCLKRIRETVISEKEVGNGIFVVTFLIFIYSKINQKIGLTISPCHFPPFFSWGWEEQINYWIIIKWNRNRDYSRVLWCVVL